MASKSDLSNVDGVIVISVTEHPPEYIIKKILNTENLPSPTLHNGSIKGYEWKLDTKYYNTTVNLYSIQEQGDFDDDFCESIQATIFYFDGNEPSSFKNVLNWISSLKCTASEVQLLVCENSSNNEVLQKKILNWCVENQYELIDINPVPESDEEEDDGLFSKSKGFGRVIESLQAHTWPNLIMKDEVKEQNFVEKEVNDEKANSDISAASSMSAMSVDNSKKMKVGNEEVVLEEQWLQKVLEQDDPEGESFEALFSKFASMKERASGLNGEERKKYAEEVAIAFWKAMGGEEDEIAGLDDG